MRHPNPQEPKRPDAWTYTLVGLSAIALGWASVLTTKVNSLGGRITQQAARISALGPAGKTTSNTRIVPMRTMP